MYKRELYAKIAVRARNEAKNMRENAGHADRMDDGGAGSLEDLVTGWEYGLAGEVPHKLQKYEELIKTEDDPDWTEYQRLKKKFDKY